MKNAAAVSVSALNLDLDLRTLATLVAFHGLLVSPVDLPTGTFAHQARTRAALAGELADALLVELAARAPTCSLCGRPESPTLDLLAGLRGHLCVECADLARDLLAQREAREPETSTEDHS